MTGGGSQPRNDGTAPDLERAEQLATRQDVPADCQKAAPFAIR